MPKDPITHITNGQETRIKKGNLLLAIKLVVIDITEQTHYQI
jgi:hypothetical protein